MSLCLVPSFEVGFSVKAGKLNINNRSNDFLKCGNHGYINTPLIYLLPFMRQKIKFGRITFI